MTNRTHRDERTDTHRIENAAIGALGFVSFVVTGVPFAEALLYTAAFFGVAFGFEVLRQRFGTEADGQRV